jgi:hypothetical protein
MKRRDLEALCSTEAFTALCRECDGQYLVHRQQVFVRTPCLLLHLYSHDVERVIYFRVCRIGQNQESSIDGLMNELSDAEVMPIFEWHRSHHRDPITPLDHPNDINLVLSQEAYFFAYLEIIRRYMQDFLRCDLGRYAAHFRAIEAGAYANALARFQAGWGRSAPLQESSDAPDQAERAVLRLALAHAALVEVVIAGAAAPGSAPAPAQPQTVDVLRAESTRLRQAVHDALNDNLRSARAAAQSFAKPGTSLDGLVTEPASDAARQELRWAAEAVRRTADAVVRLTEGAGARADDAPAPGAAPTGAQAVELALYRVALAHDQLRREASGLDMAAALRDDADAIRAALRATHSGDPGEAARERARHVLALARAHGGGERAAAAAAELALWADRASDAARPYG